MKTLHTAINLSHLEGGLYALMVASIENFLFYYAVQRQVSATELGLISTLPLLVGALGQYFLPGIVTEKGLGPWVIRTMFVQVLGVVGIFLHAYFPLPFEWLLLSTILFYLGGMSSTPLWIDWAQNLIPQRNFRFYMARRNSYTWWLILIFFVSFALLNRFLGLELRSIFLIGVLARIFSGVLQIYIQKSSYIQHRERRVKHQKNLVRLVDLKIKSRFFSFDELKNFVPMIQKSILIFLFVTAFFKFGVQIAGPFFVDYMVKDLELDMLSFVILYSIPSLGRALFYKNWTGLSSGYLVFSTISMQMFYLSIIPLVWTISRSLWFLIPMEIVAGCFWGGFEYLSVMFIQNSLGKNSRKYIGFNMALGALFGLFGALCGAKLLGMGFSYHQLMVASFFGRFGIWIILLFSIGILGSAGGFKLAEIIHHIQRFLKLKT